MSVVAAAVRSSVAVLASSVLVVTMVTPSAAEPAVVQADPDLTVVLGAPTSTPAETLKPQLPEGDFAVEASRNVASRCVAGGGMYR